MTNNLLEATNSAVLSKKDVVIGTVIALVMGTTFTLLSSGMSLTVTFVSGVVFSWLTYVWIFVEAV